MESTRVDTRALVAAAARAEKLVREANDALAPFLVALTEAEREGTLRTPLRLPSAARELALAARAHPDLAKRADFDPAAVVEDLENVAAIDGLANLLQGLVRSLDDSRLRWLAEAYEPSLALYRLARAAATVDGSLGALVEPMEEVFASRRSPKKKE